MDSNLDTELRRLSKIEPSKGFIRASKNRLMQQISLCQKETWFQSFVRKLGGVSVSPDFIAQARLRLMFRMAKVPQPIRLPLHGFALFLNYTKKVVASTMVMLIAVTSTLFFVEGNTVVVASDDSYLEVLAGTVSIKHPDFIVWEDVNQLIEVQAGDLIKVQEGSQAIIRFFDDSELRLAENTLLLITQLAVSPGFGGQAVAEVSLHEGRAWVQTLNVDDGFAGFTLSTRDAIIKAINGTFHVTARLNAPTSVNMISGKAELTSLVSETRQAVKNIKLAANQKADIHTANGHPLITTTALSEQDMAQDWIQTNLRLDREHLTVLREKGFERLTQMAGTLPGEMLYPVKQAKERLKLAFSSDGNLDLQIEIANRRLNEALVLFEAGQQQKGREALMAYQSMARQMVEHSGAEKLENKIVTPHKKILTAELPSDASVGLVKEALHETSEILTEDPIEREKVRLANAVQRLEDASAMMENGDLVAVKERLTSHQLVTGDALAAAEAIEDEEQKKEALQAILELRQEELVLLATLAKKLDTSDSAEDELMAMVESASEAARQNVELAMTAATPFMPELKPVSENLSPEDIKLAELIEKIKIYNSYTGQQNQIERLLKNELANTGDINYLISVRDKLDGRTRDYLSTRILQLEKKAELQKSKAVQRKIERSIRLRDNTTS